MCSLWVRADEFPGGGDQDRGVQAEAVVSAIRVLSPLVQGCVDRDAELPGSFGSEGEGGAGEEVLGDVRWADACRGVVLRPGVGGVAGERQFRQENNSGSQLGGALDAFGKFCAEGGFVGMPAVLDNADAQRRPRGGFGAGQGSRGFEAGYFNHGGMYSDETTVTK